MKTPKNLKKKFVISIKKMEELFLFLLEFGVWSLEFGGMKTTDRESKNEVVVSRDHTNRKKE